MKLLIIPIVIVTIIIGAIIAIYVFNFNGSFKSDQTGWGSFGDYFGGVLASTVGLVSFIIAIYALLNTAKREKNNNLLSFMKDYRSKEMSEDIKMMWDFHNKYVSKDFKEESSQYKKELDTLKTEYKIQHENQTNIYKARRNLSHFYLQLAIFVKNNELDKILCFSVWTKDVLKILKQILIPCELAISEEIKQPTKIRPFYYLIDLAEKYKNKYCFSG